MSNMYLDCGLVDLRTADRLTKTCANREQTICSFFVEETFDHVLGKEIDHVSPMFISEHESMQIRDAK